MAVYPSPRIAECFNDLVDPRIARTPRHALLDIVTLALCGVICGAESWVEIEDWADATQAWVHTWLDLPHPEGTRIPSHDTFGRVFSRIDPTQFEAGCLRWEEGVALATAGAVLSINGKTIRSTRALDGNPLHIVNAWPSTLGWSSDETRSMATTTRSPPFRTWCLDSTSVTRS